MYIYIYMYTYIYTHVYIYIYIMCVYIHVCISMCAREGGGSQVRGFIACKCSQAEPVARSGRAGRWAW